VSVIDIEIRLVLFAFSSTARYKYFSKRNILNNCHWCHIVYSLRWECDPSFKIWTTTVL